MAHHKDLPIYAHAYGLLRLSLIGKANMRRDFKQSLGTRIHDECIEILSLIADANAANPVDRPIYIQEMLRRGWAWSCSVSVRSLGQLFQTLDSCWRDLVTLRGVFQELGPQERAHRPALVGCVGVPESASLVVRDCWNDEPAIACGPKNLALPPGKLLWLCFRLLWEPLESGVLKSNTLRTPEGPGRHRVRDGWRLTPKPVQHDSNDGADQEYPESHAHPPVIAWANRSGYTAPVTPKKGVIGLGSPLNRCDASRRLSAGALRLVRSCPKFWRLGREAARPAGSRKRFPVCQPVRAAAIVWQRWAAVVANRTAWRPIMAFSASSGARAPASSPVAPEVTRDLRNTVNMMDCLSQEGFSEIAAIAKLALRSLETPDGCVHLDNIAYALHAIWGKADDIKNCINVEAEGVGCNYVDDAKRRRWDARSAAKAKICNLHQGGQS